MTTEHSSTRNAALPGRPEAAAAIWDWRGAETPERPSPALRPRLRGALQAVAGAAAAAVLWLLGASVLATIAATLAAVILASALLSPGGLYAAIDRAFHALGHGVGRALTWLLLPAVFYLFFAPFGVLFRRGRRDTMRRAFDPEADSYWTPRRAVPAAESFRRQF